MTKQYTGYILIFIFLTLNGCSISDKYGLYEKNSIRSENVQIPETELTPYSGLDIRARILEISPDDYMKHEEISGLLDLARRSINNRYGKITIAWPSTLNVNRKVREITGIMNKAGIQSSDITGGSYNPRDRNGKDSIIVWYNETVISEQSCQSFAINKRFTTSGEDWRRYLSDNSAHSGFGCSMRSNLAKMVSDPRDIYRARPFTPQQANHEQSPSSSSSILGEGMMAGQSGKDN